MIGGTVPLDTADQPGTGTRTSWCDRRFRILDGGHWRLKDSFTRLSIQHAQDTVLADRADQIPRAPADGGAVERAGVGEVPVVVVGRHELLAPDEFAGPKIKGNDGVGVEIRTAA